MNLLLPLTLAGLAAGVGGCGQTQYAGDGRLEKIPRPQWLCTDRYIVHLGSVDLSEPTIKVYTLAGLPSTEFVVGFDVAAVERNRDVSAAKPVHSVVRVMLTNERGETVVSTGGLLSDWTWSSASNALRDSFVYQRGEQSEHPIGNDTVEVRREKVAPDEGWGSYFTPRTKGKYILRVAVQRGEPDAKHYSVSVNVEGGEGCEL
jgi:hypothetical protein